MLRQVLVFFNFSATEDKGDCFSGVGDPTMILEQVQQAKEQSQDSKSKERDNRRAWRRGEVCFPQFLPQKGVRLR